MSSKLKLLALAWRGAGASPLRSWPLAAGLALGVGTWIFFQGMTAGVGQLVRDKVSGTLPDRIRVSSSVTQIGPVQLQQGLTDATVAECQKLSGVVAVYRQAHFPGPVQLFGHYGGQSMATDLILEGVDPEQVNDQVAWGEKFADPGPVPPGSTESVVPIMVPDAILDMLNAGIAAHTSLPSLSPQALTGKTFQLKIGSSSYNPVPGTQVVGRIAGVTDQVGMSGPAVPLEWMIRLAQKPVTYHTLTLKLQPGQPLGPLITELRHLGLVAPGVEAAEKVSTIVQYTQWATALFSLAILTVAAVGVSAGISLQVREQRGTIGLFRALGATRADILTIFLLRAACLGGAGTVTGFFAGLLSGELVQTYLRAKVPLGSLGTAELFRVQPSSLLAALALGLGISLLSGLLPARKAANLKPADVLRND